MNLSGLMKLYVALSVVRILKSKRGGSGGKIDFVCAGKL